MFSSRIIGRYGPVDLDDVDLFLKCFIGVLSELRDARCRGLIFENSRWHNLKRCFMDDGCHMQLKNRVDVRCMLCLLLPADGHQKLIILSFIFIPYLPVLKICTLKNDLK